MVEDQFQSYGESWDAVGYDTKGNHFFRAIEPDDISMNHEIKFEFLSITPQEEAANIAKANMLKSSGLGDDKFIDSEIMKFQDPAGREDARLMQQGKVLSPKIMMLEVIKAYRKRGENLYADILSAELEQAMMMEQMQKMIPQNAGGPPGQPPGPAAGPPSPAPPRGFNIPPPKANMRQPKSLIAGPPAPMRIPQSPMAPKR